MKALDVLLAKCEPMAPMRRCGIFFLLKDEEVVYLGESINVDERVLVIAGQKQIDFDRALYLPVAEADLLAYEGALIRALRPRFCRKFAVDTTRDVEVLRVVGLLVEGAA